jgi:hypothetical protein
MKDAETEIRESAAVLVIDRLGDPQPLLSNGDALGEFSELGMATGQPGPGLDGWKDELTEALTILIAPEGLYAPPEQLDRTTVLGEVVIRRPQVLIRHEPEREISDGLANGQSTLASLDGSVVVPHPAEVDDQVGENPSEPTWIVQRLGEGPPRHTA